MDSYILLRYFHFIMIFVLVSSIIGVHLLLEDRLSRRAIKKISVLDRIQGMSALLVVGTGLILWFLVGKPAEFYNRNWILHTKVTMVIVVGLLSIVPTRFFIKNGKGESNEMVTIPARIKHFIRAQLLLLFIIPLLAALMTQGRGSF